MLKRGKNYLEKYTKRMNIGQSVVIIHKAKIGKNVNTFLLVV